MPRAKKGQQIVLILKKTTGLCPTRCYYSMPQTERTTCTWHPAGRENSRHGPPATLQTPWPAAPAHKGRLYIYILFS